MKRRPERKNIRTFQGRANQLWENLQVRPQMCPQNDKIQKNRVMMNVITLCFYLVGARGVEPPTP